MTATIPTKEPAAFTAGDTVQWTKALADYPPADGWVLTYQLLIADAQKTITGTDNGDGTHLVTLTAALSANYAAGIYYWQGYVTKGAERVSVAAGHLEVKPNFAALTSGYDGRSHVKTVLDALQATIEGKATKDQQAYTINGRELTRYTPGDLIKWHNHYARQYQQELQAEAIKNGQQSGQNIRVRF